MLLAIVLVATIPVPALTTLIPLRPLEATWELRISASAPSTMTPSTLFVEITDLPSTVIFPPFTTLIPFSVFSLTLEPVTTPVAASITSPSVPFPVTCVSLVRETLDPPVT